MASKFTFQTTDDGSPTLEIMRSDGKAEKMHHYMGAFSETVHVYGRALEMALEKRFPFTVFSLGLGLGYNEIMTSVLGTKLAKTPMIWSFETEENLRSQFQNWIMDVESNDDFSLRYNQILKSMSEHFEVSAYDVKKDMKSLLENKKLKLLGGFNYETDLTSQEFSIIFYDAFSDKINPELWDEAALEHILKNGVAEQCVFATYASKGRLKRALKNHRFKLQDIAGYGNKRECTVAVRYS